MFAAAARRTWPSLPRSVRLVEVGPRDGLQNEAVVVSTAQKVELIRKLLGAGMRHIEATAFVSPKWVPQMGDHKDVMEALKEGSTLDGVTYSVLVPNLKGNY